ncbi:alpha-1-antitrypsin-like [Scleropages formosus]|uniref:Thyroxine-binding globulin n=1 Tax=Scleropages formosus TaxID=113540 RepID=A0A8C9RPK6_SCLFO|nr:alpha-1-antitrypsin-like [Scleropages formosus]
MRLLFSLCIILLVLCISVLSDHHGHGDGQNKKGQHGKEHGKKDEHKDGHKHERHHGHHGHHGHHRDRHHHHEKHENGSLRLYKENGEFAFSLYKQIASKSDSQSKNIFFSPLSVSLALAALSLGTRGKTHQQLFSGLGFNETEITVEEVNEAFHQILLDLSKKADVDLSVGSALFMHNTFKPQPEFLENMKRYYHSEGFTADFTKTTDTTDLINKYVKDKTHGKISKLVKDLDPSTVMYLISYMYFKGKWEIPFDPEKTQGSIFHVNKTHKVPVQMMAKSDSFFVYHDKEISAHVLQLRYNGSVSMMLILPEHGLEAFEKVFSRAHMKKWYRHVKETHCEVYIPKFSIETSYDLKDILTGMGITDIFSAGADFTGISDSPLVVSKVVQKATLDVDESGSTATAATGVEVMLMSVRFPLILRFDRPFMMIIGHHETRSLLFMGKIVNPTGK